MPRPSHYSPAIERFLVRVLYYEAQYREIPMTQLTNEILKRSLSESVGWQMATQATEQASHQTHGPDAQ
jgi:hypothetical protein